MVAPLPHGVGLIHNAEALRQSDSVRRELVGGSSGRPGDATGLVAMWEEYYDQRPGPTPRLEVVQVLPLPGRRFPLDVPHTTLDS